MLYDMEGDLPEEPFSIPFGEANFIREGDDVTIVAIGRMVQMASEAGDALAQDGIQCEIVDPRTTSPLDEDSILESVEKTGRLVIVDESGPRCGMAADIASLVATQAFDDLKAPIQTVTPPHTPVPFNDFLEDLYIPDTERVVKAVRNIVKGN
jgi:pyruvate dehydrogenase E1 component beta subunit